MMRALLALGTILATCSPRVGHTDEIQLVEVAVAGKQAEPGERTGVELTRAGRLIPIIPTERVRRLHDGDIIDTGQASVAIRWGDKRIFLRPATRIQILQRELKRLHVWVGELFLDGGFSVQTEYFSAASEGTQFVRVYRRARAAT